MITTTIIGTIDNSQRTIAKIKYVCPSSISIITNITITVDNNVTKKKTMGNTLTHTITASFFTIATIIVLLLIIIVIQ